MKIFSEMLKGGSIRFKLLFYFFSLILFPIVTLGFIGNMIYTRTIEQETNTHTVQMIDQVKKNVEFYIKDMENIIYYLSKEPQVVRFLQIQNNQDADREQSELEVRRILKTFMEIHSEIAGIMIVNKNDVFVSNEMYRIARDPLVEDSWYRQAMDSPESIQLISKPIGRNITTRLNYSADSVLSIVKAVKNPAEHTYAGVILIDMKLDTIKKVIEDIKLGKNGFICITDTSGGIVYAPVNPIVYRIKDEWLDSGDNSIVKKIKDSSYQIIFKHSNYTKWKTVGVFSLNETLQEVSSIRYYSFIIAILTLVLAVIAALFFTASIAKPVGKLRSLMKKAEEGDLNVRFKSKYNDEIGQLGNSFNNMIEEIRKLIELVYTEQKSKREAELKTLQAQIKPHFLYNTLDTIQWMAQGHGANDIVEIVGALTNLFRIGLNKGQEMIRLQEELNHVKSYLVIQKARYEDKLEYEVGFDPEIAEHSVLKLILQPLVENAIYHGIKARRGVGKIAITVKKVESRLVFKVSDNGIGILPEKLQEIKSMIESKTSSNPGYGIFNVNERLRLTFGQEYGLKFDSIYGEGTTVEVIHPIIQN